MKARITSDKRIFTSGGSSAESKNRVSMTPSSYISKRKFGIVKDENLTENEDDSDSAEDED